MGRTKEYGQTVESEPIVVADKTPMGNLGHGAARALLVAAGGAGGADDNHASTLAAVLVGRHVGDGGLFWCFW